MNQLVLFRKGIQQLPLGLRWQLANSIVTWKVTIKLVCCVSLCVEGWSFGILLHQWYSSVHLATPRKIRPSAVCWSRSSSWRWYEMLVKRWQLALRVTCLLLHEEIRVMCPILFILSSALSWFFVVAVSLRSGKEEFRMQHDVDWVNRYTAMYVGGIRQSGRPRK